jgi:hypothetical protein
MPMITDLLACGCTRADRMWIFCEWHAIMVSQLFTPCCASFAEAWRKAHIVAADCFYLTLYGGYQSLQACPWCGATVGIVAPGAGGAGEPVNEGTQGAPAPGVGRLEGLPVDIEVVKGVPDNTMVMVARNVADETLGHYDLEKGEAVIHKDKQDSILAIKNIGEKNEADNS